MRPNPKMLLDYREFPVLFVDDEPGALRLFELGIGEGFRILTASGGEQALRILNDQPVAVVMSDSRMPGMSGSELLARARALDPMTIRILVTAYGDGDTLRAAINDGAVHRYVQKPWDPEDLRARVRAAIDAYAIARERDALLFELTQLNHVSKALHSELAIEKLCALLVESTHRDLGFDGVSLLLFGADGDLEWRGLAPEEPRLAERLHRLRIGPRSAPRFCERLGRGEVQTLRRTIAAQLEPVLRSWLTELAAEAVLIAPLIGEHGVLGALAIDNRSRGLEFAVEVRTLVDGLALHAVVALENARLVSALHRSSEAIARAHQLGALANLLVERLAQPASRVPETAREASPNAGAARLSPDDLVAALRKVTGLAARIGMRGELDGAQWIREAQQRFAARAHSAGVALRCEVDDDLPALQGDAEALGQTIDLLLENALEATSADGTVSLTLGRDPDAPETRVTLIVEDSGSGIEESDLAQIFEPFFSRRGRVGLGLALCREVVSDHGGTIEVASCAGEGTRFVVRLPIATAPSPAVTLH